VDTTGYGPIRDYVKALSGAGSDLSVVPGAEREESNYLAKIS